MTRNADIGFFTILSRFAVIYRMVYVFGLPLDSFAFDVIFWPDASSVHLLACHFSLA